MISQSIKSSLAASLLLAGLAMAATPATSTPAADAPKAAAATAAPAGEKPVAAQAAKAAKSAWAKGTVISSDAIASTVTIKEKKGEVVYTLEKDAKISKAGAPATLEDLKADTKIKLRFKKEGDKMVATQVEIGGVAAAKQAPAAK